MSQDFKTEATPQKVQERLSELVPGFGVAWKDSLFIAQDCSFTVHGVFAEFSSYLRDHFAELCEERRKQLFHYVEECVTAGDRADMQSMSDLSNAVCTCFLETIAGEGKISEMVSAYLGSESRRYFDQWN